MNARILIYIDVLQQKNLGKELPDKGALFSISTDIYVKIETGGALMAKLPPLDSLGNPLGDKILIEETEKESVFEIPEEVLLRVSLSEEERETEARYFDLLSKLNLKQNLTLEYAEQIVDSLGIKTFEEMERELENENPLLMKINALFIQKILLRLGEKQENLEDLEINSIDKFYKAIESGLINLNFYSIEEIDEFFSSLLTKNEGAD